jgi:hypothetical protein
MVCYQVLAQFAFNQGKSVLVTTHIKKQETKAFLVLSGLPFGADLKYRRFFWTEGEAARYVLYLRRVYKNRIVPHPALPAMDGGYKQVDEFLQRKNSKLKIRKEADFKHGGQQYLFQEVSK